MNRTLLSLAIVKTNWERRKKDHIENYVPLVGSLIANKKYASINISNMKKIQEDFYIEYGVHLPLSALEMILKRMTKQKYISRERSTFKPHHEKINILRIDKESEQQRRKFALIQDAIKDFAASELNYNLTDKDVEDGLLQYLGKYDLDLLFASESVNMLPKVDVKQKVVYVINRYIVRAAEREPDNFRYIRDIAIGQALSASVIYNKNNSYSGKMHKLQVYLDTPFIFGLLGVNGRDMQGYAEELIQMLSNENVQLKVLDITQHEVDSNIEEALKLLERGERDPSKGTRTFRCCIENAITMSDLEAIYIGLSDIYEKHGIKPDVVPEYDEGGRYQIDEEKLYLEIDSTYQELKVDVNNRVHGNGDGAGRKQARQVPNGNGESEIELKLVRNGDDAIADGAGKQVNNTILRDVRVLSGVYRLREGNRPKTLKQCRHMFITTNSSLALASRRFEKKEIGPSRTLPVCITDALAGTMIWMQSPAQYDEIFSKKLISDCYAAMMPSEKLIGLYLEEVERLKDSGTIDDDSYYMLRTHRAAINMLESKTMGDIDEFSKSTPEEILDALLAREREEGETKLNKEKDQHLETKSELERLKKELADRLTDIDRRDEMLKKRNAKVKASIEEKAKNHAKRTSYGIVIFAGIMLALALAVQFYNAEWGPVEFGYRLASWLVISVSGLFNILYGFNVAHMRKTLLHLIQNRIERRLTSRYESLFRE